ncbi:response regulator [Micromonospora chersina]|uniref:response regulator n=1 Tax=Micromonospora chersina TaxID=47854 RepID=UPI0037B2C0EE
MIALVERTQPDVVLTDLAMPGAAATRRIRARWPGVRVLVLTMHDDDEAVFGALPRRRARVSGEGRRAR